MRKLRPQDFKTMRIDNGYRWLECDLGAGRTICIEPNQTKLDVACYEDGTLAIPRKAFNWYVAEPLTNQSNAFKSLTRVLSYLNSGIS